MADFSSLLAPQDQQTTAPQGGSNFYTGMMPQPASGMDAASQLLQLNPQERALYQMHLDNLHGSGGVDNPPDEQHPEGSRSTLYQSVQEHGGKFYNIPTVWSGKREVEPYTKPDGTVMDVPNKTALANVEKLGWDKFPSYSNPDQADARYDAMHQFMDRDTSQYLAARKQ